MKKIQDGIKDFFIKLFTFIAFLGGLFLFGWVFSFLGEEYAFYGVWIYLLIFPVYFLIKTYKKYITRENLKKAPGEIVTFTKSLLHILFRLILILIGVILISIFFGWLAGLSATTIIIILLILILLK